MRGRIASSAIVPGCEDPALEKDLSLQPRLPSHKRRTLAKAPRSRLPQRAAGPKRMCRKRDRRWRLEDTSRHQAGWRAVASAVCKLHAALPRPARRPRKAPEGTQAPRGVRERNSGRGRPGGSSHQWEPPHPRGRGRGGGSGGHMEGPSCQKRPLCLPRFPFLDSNFPGRG